MAELRTIERFFEIETLSVTGQLLSLPDQYVIIPHLLYLSRQLDDYVITILGPNGIFLVSYQLLVESISTSIEDSIIYLREYAVSLQDFFFRKNIDINPELNLILVSNDSNFDYLEEESDDLRIIHLNNIKKLITYTKIEKPLTTKDIEKITNYAKANPAKRINQYQLLMETERSDTMVDYLAYNTILDIPVIIKEIKNYNNHKIQDIEKNEILREVKLTMQLYHENIINIEQIIPKEDSLYVVIEWAEKTITLADLINTDLDIEIIKKIIIQICEALEYANNKGIVHRNIKPQNVIITANYNVKITNFDFAKKLDISTRSTYDLKQMMKENPYSAPELRLGSDGHHSADQRVDVYSTGVIIYELLTKRLPSHIDEKYWESPSLYNDKISDEFDNIVLKAIRFDPHQRFSTISALKNRLLDLGKQKGELASENRYINRQILKRTRNSIIYSGLDKKLSRNVALKKVLLDPFLTSDQRQQNLSKLMAEANIVSKLTHPNIINVYDYFIEDEDCYIVMELLEGNSLRELQSKTKVFDIDTVLNIGIQVAETIEYLHNQNIMHRDIKPENIIYQDGQITILDFGIAGLLEQEDRSKLYGTVLYMSPEQMSENPIIDRRSEIFSLGVLLYELITNKTPYDPSVIMGQYKSENIIEPLPPSEINYDSPKELDVCIKKALKINKDERYTNVSEFIEDLKNIRQTQVVSLQSSSSEQIKKFLHKVPIGTIILIIFFFIFFIYLLNTIFQKDKKDNSNIPNVVVSVPVVPINIFSPTPSSTISEIKEKSLEPSPSPSVSKTPESTPTPTETAIKDNIKTKWLSSSANSNGVNFQANLEVNKEQNKTNIHLSIKNNSEDELEILNRTDIPDLLTIKDNLGNDYTKNVDIRSVSSELIRIYSNSSANGSFIMNTIPNPQAESLIIKISEYEGKQRTFSLKLSKIKAD